jgi:hypothetical protein
VVAPRVRAPLLVFYCPEHNAGGQRNSCPTCVRERNCERDNGYLRGWEDGLDTIERALPVVGLMWALWGLYERGGVA